MTIGYFLNKARDVKIRDLLSFGKLSLAVLMRPFVERRYAHCWVVCETPLEARDNGYHFYKYVKTRRPEIVCFYAIDKRSPDYAKVAEYGDVIAYGSIEHWIAYLCADHNISSQKAGKPNGAVCAFLELMHWIDSRFVFLQHGVIINDVEWAHAETTQLQYFITSTIPEAGYVRDTFGYRRDQIVLTGLPRFDALHDFTKEEGYVLIMPTWRSRFVLNSQKKQGGDGFTGSQYKRCWEELLNSPKLRGAIEDKGLKVVFFPHRGMQEFLSEFKIEDPAITVADWGEYDIQEELKKASIMITDYSSVFFDMVYMKKPVIFYQFDHDDFRRFDYAKGYFDYRDDVLGKWCETSDEVIEELLLRAEDRFAPTERALEEHRKIFPFYDRENSKRIADLLAGAKAPLSGGGRDWDESG
ncbi:CDP-glycerol glycerophosphotransferase family protein [uncultured Oscillibacter sp.]|uniref:CDP-glycerol glycerophosphotransferase family protein n=1 Tax=uncultured Oscillibacter sp. TaxID=876091 RepID=UPI0025D9F911|nr:CDP-glycerol glycerophosphotransferase family protein [uncultured Oscillibacter sp.]